MKILTPFLSKEDVFDQKIKFCDSISLKFKNGKNLLGLRIFQNEIKFLEWIEINEKFGIWTGGSSCWLNFLRTFKTEFFWWWMMESPYSSLACPLLFLSSLVAVLSSLENNQRGVLFSLALEWFGVYHDWSVLHFWNEVRVRRKT